MVNECVNAITGDFVYSTVDMVIPGPEPLIFERTYFSSLSAGSLCHGWRHNHTNSISFTPFPDSDADFKPTGEETLYTTYMEPSGRGLEFKKEHYDRKHRVTLTANDQTKMLGLTNWRRC